LNIRLSISLVTRNRPESLEKTLRSLCNQEPFPFEIIVSDDSNAQSIISINQELCGRFGCKYLHGPQKGLYTNRNFAAKHCSGTHIRSMDDDHTFPENHIKECLSAIESDTHAIWVIGEYYPFDNNIPRLAGWRVNYDGGISGLPLSIPGQLHPRGYAYLPQNMNNYYGISCGSTIYPRAVFERNIFYSEFYKFGILYLEYGARLLKNGFKIRHLSGTYIIHHCAINDPSVVDKEITYGAKIFSILMFSFLSNRTIKNQVLTLLQIIKEVIQGNFSVQNSHLHRD